VAGESFLSRSPWLVVAMPDPGIRAASQELIEELMGSVVAIDFLLPRLRCSGRSSIGSATTFR
jgi:hypothetical protein